MNALLDAIGAVAVGGVILLAVISGMHNIQVYSYNTSLQATLTTTSEISSAALQDRYLSAAGMMPANLMATTNPDTMIISATRKQLQFYAEIDGSIQVVNIQQGTQDGTTGWYPFSVLVGGNLDYGIFFTSVENVFTYFDENHTQIAFVSNAIPSADLENIRLVRVDLSFVLRGMSQLTGGNRTVMNRIVFWQYFKNLYL